MTTLEKGTGKEMTGLAAIGTKLWKIEGDLIKGMKYQPYNASLLRFKARLPVNIKAKSTILERSKVP